MNIEMVPLEIIGLKADLHATLHTLRRLGCMHIDPLEEIGAVSARPLTLDRETLRSQEEMSFLLARVDGLLEALGCSSSGQSIPPQEDYLAEARSCVETLLPKVQSLIAQRSKLQSELATLPRYEITLRKLLPIIPASARDVGNASIGILVNRAHVGVLDSIGKRVLEFTAGRAEVVASDVDVATRVMLIVFPQEIGRAHV